MGKSIKSKKRVQDHGEVFTDEREVKAMCDLINDSINDHSIIILEPACGNGNFLVEIMTRRLVLCDNEVDTRAAVSTIFGVDIQLDNVIESKERIQALTEFDIMDILDVNIVQDDTLNLNLDQQTPHKYRTVDIQHVIMNPPYQQMDGGASASATAFYPKFFDAMKKIKTVETITMIIPARWLISAKGAEEFTKELKNSENLVSMMIYPNSKDCFPDNGISGGILYFKWDRNYKGMCTISTFGSDDVQTCDLSKFNAIQHSIRAKVKPDFGTMFDDRVSPRQAFGLATNFSVTIPKEPTTDLFGMSSSEDEVKVFYRENHQSCTKMIPRDLIKTNRLWVDQYKVFIAYTGPGALGEVPTMVTATPWFGNKGEVSSETYLVVNPSDDKTLVENTITYMKTKTFRYLVRTLKNTQHCTKDRYKNVPLIPLTQPVIDEWLYKYFEFTPEEIKEIENTIKPMK